MQIGARYAGEFCDFTVWAPLAAGMTLKVLTGEARELPMKKDPFGYWQARAEGVGPGTRYLYLLEDGSARPDPASFFQPDGPNGHSEVIDHAAFLWEDAGHGSVSPGKMIMYELHTGTFTPEGTFDAVAGRLDHLLGLGVNAVELMPVGQFPGERNWGYDGTYLFAAQNSYGGPVGLKRLVNACHKKGLAVILDVVYNHAGPEGSYLDLFGPYHTDKYKTPWGKAVNFDDAYSYGVRNHVIENALYWFEHFHIDALRLDAVHSICDMSAKHILEELSEQASHLSLRLGRPCYLIAESDLNDPRLINDRRRGGYGMDAQWSDDFHHSVHTLLTGERSGYYLDFGDVEHLKKAVTDGFVYAGAYSAARKRFHGKSSRSLPADRLVACIQNHDQTGNRAFGERLSVMADFDSLKTAAGVLLTAPSAPLLFMGEEYAEDSPFMYFVDYESAELNSAVREGRKRDLSYAGNPPEPASAETFLRSKLCWEKLPQGRHAVMYEYYRALIALRKTLPVLANGNRETLTAGCDENSKLFWLRRADQTGAVFCLANFGSGDAEYKPALTGTWVLALDSSEPEWLGPGSEAPTELKEGIGIKIKKHGFLIYRAVT